MNKNLASVGYHFDLSLDDFLFLDDDGGCDRKVVKARLVHGRCSVKSSMCDLILGVYLHLFIPPGWILNARQNSQSGNSEWISTHS